MTKEQSTIIQIYSAFIVALIFNFVPSTAIQAFGGLLLLILIITIYIYKSKSDPDSLMFNHMAYALKSFWISSLFLAIGIGFAVLLGDHSIINSTTNAIINGTFLTEEQLEEIMINYLHQNFLIFSFTLGPSIIYLVYRVIKGIIYAKNNEKISNLKSWL